MHQDGYKVPLLRTVEFRNIFARLILLSIYWCLQYIKPENMLFGVRIHAIVSFLTFISIFLNLNDIDKIVEKYEVNKTMLNFFVVFITIYTLIIPLFSVYIRYHLATTFSSQIEVIKIYALSFTGIIVCFGWMYYSKYFFNKNRFYILYGSFLQIVSAILLLMVELNVFDKAITIFEVISHNHEYSSIYVYILITFIFIINNILIIKNHSRLAVSLLAAFINIILSFDIGFKVEHFLSDLGWETLIISNILCISAIIPLLESIVQNQKGANVDARAQ